MRATCDPIYHRPGDPVVPPFRSGSAGRVDLEGFREIRSVVIDPNSYHALFHFGVVPRLAALPCEDGPLERGAEVVFFPAAVESWIAELYAAERVTYAGEHDILVARAARPESREYRVRLVRREYQRTLIRLIDLGREAAYEGHAIRLSL